MLVTNVNNMSERIYYCFFSYSYTKKEQELTSCLYKHNNKQWLAPSGIQNQHWHTEHVQTIQWDTAHEIFHECSVKGCMNTVFTWSLSKMQLLMPLTVLWKHNRSGMKLQIQRQRLNTNNGAATKTHSRHKVY